MKNYKFVSMKRLIGYFYLTSFLFLLSNCNTSEDYLNTLNDASLFNDAMQELTDVVVYDIFSPPVASRVYVYPTIAAYSIMQAKRGASTPRR